MDTNNDPKPVMDSVVVNFQLYIVFILMFKFNSGSFD